MIDWIAALLLWVGNFILIWKRHWAAFIVFFFANILWFIYWLSKEEWAAMFLVGTFMAQNVYAIYCWRKDGKS